MSPAVSSDRPHPARRGCRRPRGSPPPGSTGRRSRHDRGFLRDRRPAPSRGLGVHGGHAVVGEIEPRVVRVPRRPPKRPCECPGQKASLTLRHLGPGASYAQRLQDRRVRPGIIHGTDGAGGRAPSHSPASPHRGVAHESPDEVDRPVRSAPVARKHRKMQEEVRIQAPSTLSVPDPARITRRPRAYAGRTEREQWVDGEHSLPPDCNQNRGKPRFNRFLSGGDVERTWSVDRGGVGLPCCVGRRSVLSFLPRRCFARSRPAPPLAPFASLAAAGRPWQSSRTGHPAALHCPRSAHPLPFSISRIRRPSEMGRARLPRVGVSVGQRLRRHGTSRARDLAKEHDGGMGGESSGRRCARHRYDHHSSLR